MFRFHSVRWSLRLRWRLNYRCRRRPSHELDLSLRLISCNVLGEVPTSPRRGTPLR